MSGVSINIGTMWRLQEDFDAVRRLAVRDRFGIHHHHYHHHRHPHMLYSG